MAPGSRIACSSSTRRRTARGESGRVGVFQPPRVDPRHRPGPWKSAADELRELAQRRGRRPGASETMTRPRTSTCGTMPEAHCVAAVCAARRPRMFDLAVRTTRAGAEPGGRGHPWSAARHSGTRAARLDSPLRRARPATTDRQVGPGRTRRAGRRDPGSERRAAAPPGRSAAAPRSLSRPERRAPAPSAARATGCCHLTRRDSFPIMVLRVSLYHIMAPVAEGSNIMRYLSDCRRSCRIVAGSSIMGACDEQRGCAR